MAWMEEFHGERHGLRVLKMMYVTHKKFSDCPNGQAGVCVLLDEENI